MCITLWFIAAMSVLTKELRPTRRSSLSRSDHALRLRAVRFLMAFSLSSLENAGVSLASCCWRSTISSARSATPAASRWVGAMRAIVVARHLLQHREGLGDVTDVLWCRLVQACKRYSLSPRLTRSLADIEHVPQAEGLDLQRRNLSSCERIEVRREHRIHRLPENIAELAQRLVQLSSVFCADCFSAWMLMSFPARQLDEAFDILLQRLLVGSAGCRRYARRIDGRRS